MRHTGWGLTSVSQPHLHSRVLVLAFLGLPLEWVSKPFQTPHFCLYFTIPRVMPACPYRHGVSREYGTSQSHTRPGWHCIQCEVLRARKEARVAVPGGSVEKKVQRRGLSLSCLSLLLCKQCLSASREVSWPVTGLVGHQVLVLSLSRCS